MNTMEHHSAAGSIDVEIATPMIEDSLTESTKTFQEEDAENASKVDGIDALLIQPPALEPASATGADMDIQSLCLSQDFEAMADVEKVVTNVPFGKPDKEWFFRIHPEFKLYMAIVAEKQEQYVADPKLLAELNGNFVKKMVVLGVSKQGTFFFWPLKVEAERGLDDWSRSALTAMEIGKKKWTKLKANNDAQCYEAFTARGQFGEPTWPDEIPELLKIATRDRVISSLDHPVIMRKNGEI